MSSIHATLTPGGDWEINVKHSWRNPPNSFLKQQPFAQKTAGDCETNVKNCLGNTSKKLLGGESHLLQRTPGDKGVILPQDIPRLLLWLKTPKLTLAGKKLGEPSTKPFFSKRRLGDTCTEKLGEPSTEPFSKRKLLGEPPT